VLPLGPGTITGTPSLDYFLAAFSGGAGSGGFVQTGSACSFEAATDVGVKAARPQATSRGTLAKSTIQPSRLKQLWSCVEPMKMQSTGHGSTHSAQNMHLV